MFCIFLSPARAGLGDSVLGLTPNGTQVWFQTLEDMKKGGAELALRDERHGGVTLNVRTQQEGMLGQPFSMRVPHRNSLSPYPKPIHITPYSTFSLFQTASCSMRGSDPNDDPRHPNPIPRHLARRMRGDQDRGGNGQDLPAEYLLLRPRGLRQC